MFLQFKAWLFSNAEPIGWVSGAAALITAYYDMIIATVGFLIFVVATAIKHFFDIKIKSEELKQAKIKTRKMDEGQDCEN